MHLPDGLGRQAARPVHAALGQQFRVQPPLRCTGWMRWRRIWPIWGRIWFRAFRLHSAHVVASSFGDFMAGSQRLVRKSPGVSVDGSTYSSAPMDFSVSLSARSAAPRAG
jgi:hypothetical protein